MSVSLADVETYAPELYGELLDLVEVLSTRPSPDTAYAKDPVGWIVDVLKVPCRTIDWAMNEGYGSHEWDGTENPLVKILEGLAEWRNVGVESATTTGKTFLGACIVLWFAACHEDSTTVTVAPKEDQLALHIWKEITKLWPAFHKAYPEAEKSYLRIRMRKDSDVWAVHGFVAGVRAEEVEGSATKAQGFHAEHMLIVFEETPGISPAIMTAFKNTCKAPHNLRLAFGNPDHQLDALHQFCIGPRTTHIRISAYDHPNIVLADPSFVPGAVSQERGIDDALLDAQDDGGKENRMFKSRVRGLSPAEAVDSLIRLEWCERAALRYTESALRTGKRALGVDVANSEAGDKAAIAYFDGACLIRVNASGCPDSNKLGSDTWKKAQELGVNPFNIGVDAIGVGAGTVNTMRKEGATSVRALQSSSKPIQSGQRAEDGTTYDWVPDANRFDNLRSQMWWQLREDLRLNRIALPNDRALFYEMTTPRFIDDAGKTVVENKKDIKKRLGGKSPDRADAVVYGNWVRPRAKQFERPGLALPGKDMAPRWDYDKKKLVKQRDADAEAELRGANRRSGNRPRVQMPRARAGR